MARIDAAMLRTTVLVAALCGAWPATLLAHCDGLDGPVVKAARAALESGSVNAVLIWVQPDDEAEIRQAFVQTMEVRALGPAAKALADRAFFETVVRLHRAGEGAPYTGLKPAGRDLGPAIPAADAALATASPAALEALLTQALRAGLRDRFREVTRSATYAPADVAAGRAHVRAYVEFIHYVERVHEAAATATHGHYPEKGGSAAPPHH